ncbi:MAG: TonB-dependent receptor plug domain-containing protein, partial [Woeseiaceae bacterium]
AVPVDVFNQEALDGVSNDDMLEIIKTLVPSFTVRRFPISDGRSFIRPPLMRGLSPDKTLVLVNGKRRHRSALVFLGANGAHGPDLATIPGNALKSVEVLRDGASALYGSDAIAGVFNFNLKDDAEGGEIRIQSGQYTEGNENAFLVSFNQGFGIGDSGFVNVSVELSDNEPTSRGTNYNLPIAQSGLTPAESSLISGFFDHDLNPSTADQQRFGPDALTEIYDPVSSELITVSQGSDGIPDDTDTRYADNLRFAEVSDSPLVQIWGEPKREAIRSFVNAGLDLAIGAQIYAWANYSDSDGNGGFFHRHPGVFELAPLREADGSLYYPRDRFPAGFTPRFAANVIDSSIAVGLRGEWANGMTYDIGSRWGESEIKYTIFNTLNASLGAASPTTFRPGDLISDEWAVSADLTMPIDMGFASDVNFAFGFEYRDEGYEVDQGDQSSYEVGPYAFEDPWNFEVDADEATAGQNGGSVGCFIPGPQFDPTSLCHPGDPIRTTVAIGSNGFPGYGPGSASAYNRHSVAAYAELEADITESLLTSIAARYEDFSDFGDNLSFRLAARWRLNDILNIRSSVGTGFRAPTPGQISTTNVSTFISDEGQPLTAGLFPADHPVSQLFGAVPLKDETSTQFTFGVTARPSDAMTLTLDYYFIAVDDQLSVSTNFFVGPNEVAQLQSLGIPGADSFAAVRFFINDFDSENRGVDLVANYNVDWGGGNTLFSLSANYNQAEVTRRTNRQTDTQDPTPIYFQSDAGVFFIENTNPDIRTSITARHSWSNGFSAMLRGSWYGDYERSNFFVTQIQKMSGKALWDFNIAWDLNEALNFSLGGNNIFNEFPDKPIFGSCCGVVYDTNSVIDWQGSYYYLRGAVRWQ